MGRSSPAARIAVRFENGDMVVEERYSFDLGPVLPSDAFVTSGGP